MLFPNFEQTIGARAACLLEDDLLRSLNDHPGIWMSDDVSMCVDEIFQNSHSPSSPQSSPRLEHHASPREEVRAAKETGDPFVWGEPAIRFWGKVANVVPKRRGPAFCKFTQQPIYKDAMFNHV